MKSLILTILAAAALGASAVAAPAHHPAKNSPHGKPAVHKQAMHMAKKPAGPAKTAATQVRYRAHCGMIYTAAQARKYHYVCPMDHKPLTKIVASAGLICPVTGNKIASPKAAAGHTAYKGKTYYFCCPMCKPKFDKAPATYIANAKKGKFEKM